MIFSAITLLAFRFARSNSIFLGLWFGYSKPDFLTFLQPFSKEFQDIYSKGICIIHLNFLTSKMKIQCKKCQRTGKMLFINQGFVYIGILSHILCY